LRERTEHHERDPYRCPYCHAGVGTGAGVRACPTCTAPHHAECYEELGKCASCGEGKTREWELYRAPDAGGRVSPPRILLRGVLVTVLLLGAFFVLQGLSDAACYSIVLVAGFGVLGFVSRSPRRIA